MRGRISAITLNASRFSIRADRVETLGREHNPPFSGWRRRVFAPPMKIAPRALLKSFRGELKRHLAPNRRINDLPQASTAFINSSTPRMLMALRIL